MRNIVLITWDSVRADHCGVYRYDTTTPFLSKIANRSLRFENAIISGLPTPVSMGGIFTSSYFNGKRIDKSITLAQVMKQGGFKTAAFHSNPFASRYYGFHKGFDVFRDYVWRRDEGFGRKSGFLNFRGIASSAISRVGVDVERVRFYYNIICVLFRNRYDVGLRFSQFYDDVVNWVNDSGGNYFVWVLLIDTHFPYTPSKWTRFKKIRSMLIYDRFYRGGGVQQKLKVDVNNEEKKLTIEAYDECIKEADSLTKQLWEDLKDTDPILIIHADHGDAFGEHGFFGHPPEHYEYLIRVPLVIYNADVKGVVKEPVSLLRLAPTICELAGIENEFKNPSLLEDVEYTPPIVENKLENGFRITVRDKEWKLISNPDRGDELYNIKKDPMEQENLIGIELDIEKDLRKVVGKHMKYRVEVEKLREGIKKLKRKKQSV